MNRKKGSAIVIVVIITLTISAYINSAVFINNNFRLMNYKYDKLNHNIYSEDIYNLSSVYDYLVKLNK